MTDPVHDYLAEIGRKGGAAGRGPAKARSSEQARKAALARWGKRKRRVFLFQPRFAALVQARRKYQTIRATPKRGVEWKAGDYADLRKWADRPYRSEQVRLYVGTITAVQPIWIQADGSLWLGGEMREGRRVALRLDQVAAEAMAKLDGFRGPSEMIEWFRATHGLPFEGVMTRWREE